MDSIDITDSNYMIQESSLGGSSDGGNDNMFYAGILLAVCILGFFLYTTFFKSSDKHVQFSEPLDCPGGFCNRE